MTAAVAEIRDRVRGTLQAHGVVHASIFGSVARGQEQPRSDIDFLVEFEEGRTLLDLSALRLALHDVLGRDVDVVTPGGLHPRIRDQVLSERVSIL